MNRPVFDRNPVRYVHALEMTLRRRRRWPNNYRVIDSVDGPLRNCAGAHE
jgi:hypothetical protein